MKPLYGFIGKIHCIVVLNNTFSMHILFPYHGKLQNEKPLVKYKSSYSQLDRLNISHFVINW